MKKVYFACAIRGGRNQAKIYSQIVSFLSSRCELLTEVFADNRLTVMGMAQPETEIYQTDMNWINQADCLIAEVSQPSLGVGYEIAVAESQDKPVLCLYKTQRDKKLSAMVAGNPNVKVVEYTKTDEALTAINDFLKSS